MSKSSEEGAAGTTSPNDTNSHQQQQKDGNGNIFEDRGRTKKIIRVVTVMAYVFSVSFVAILLSAYYVFLWEPPNPRLQRHPLSGEPQAEYLTDNLSSSLNFENQKHHLDRLPEEFENPKATRLHNILKKIMTSDQKSSDFSQGLEEEAGASTIPQKLLTYEDLLKLHHETATKIDAVTPKPTSIEKVSKSSSSSTLTSLPIFLKTYSPIPTEKYTKKNETLVDDFQESVQHDKKTLNKLTLIKKKKKNVDFSLNKNTTWSSLLPEIKKDDFDDLKLSDIIQTEVIKNEFQNQSSNSKSLAFQTTNNYENITSSPESNTLSIVTSTEDNIEGTLYPEIANYSYPETIGRRTVKNNKVTVNVKDDVVTSDDTLKPQKPSLINDMDDNNLDVSLRNQESISSYDMENEEDESTTKSSEVEIYPEEITRDVNEN